MSKSKKKGRKETSTSAGNTATLTPLVLLQRELSNLTSIRKRIIQCLTDVANAKSELTYLTNEKIDETFGSFVRPSRMRADQDDKVADLTSQLRELDNEYSATVASLVERASLIGSTQQKDDVIINTPSTSSSSSSTSVIDGESAATSIVDSGYVRSLINQVKQQALLESAAIESMLSIEQDLGDSDFMITLLACFKYPPYVRWAEVESVVQLT